MNMNSSFEPQDQHQSPVAAHADHAALLDFSDAPPPVEWGTRNNNPIDYDAIDRAALPRLREILARWLPDGRREGGEWVARNPTRADRRAGSFRVNLRTGRWADFATGDRGGGVVSLAAYLDDCPRPEAARRLAAMLGLEGRP
jgi:hypothetical protein